MKYNKQGFCPYCGSDDITYSALELVDDMIYYPCTCNECNETFKEWYKLEFTEITE